MSDYFVAEKADYLVNFGIKSSEFVDSRLRGNDVSRFVTNTVSGSLDSRLRGMTVLAVVVEVV